MKKTRRDGLFLGLVFYVLALVLHGNPTVNASYLWFAGTFFVLVDLILHLKKRPQKPIYPQETAVEEAVVDLFVFQSESNHLLP